mmetsp:Transcript_34615/g.81610  ORF Transcript_34615/g.81610 Transcript_34615/m.81610 type:complete len:209 (+) Transcript_34615:63-689(+)
MQMVSLNYFSVQKAIRLLLVLIGTILENSQSLLQEYSHHSRRLVPVQHLDRQENQNLSFRSKTPGNLLGMASDGYDDVDVGSRIEGDPHVENVLFVECGFGNDSHGQSATKAAVRACRNAIEFNSIPSVGRLVPNGYKGLKLDVLLAVPPKYKDSLDLSQVQEVFPYGSIRFQIQDGGMVAPSGIAIEKLGDTNEDMVVVCAAITVGY